ncbi:MAG: AbgT family transporter [Caulobacter sp.]|nr:AbgT family transporter [Caulobacter sp.]
MSDTTPPRKSLAIRVLDAVERFGDRLPDPVFIFLWLIGGLVVASLVCSALGVSATNPVTKEVLVAQSLLAPGNIRTLLTEMAKTFTGFAPLGLVLLVMLGAGVAERVGLLSATIAELVKAAPKALLTPMVLLIGLLSNHAADSGIVVLPPLAAVVFAAAGRHPIAGLACAYAATIASFAGNPLPGQFDALILGFTEPAARLLDPTWTANLAGNWYFTATGAVAFTLVGWWITEKVVEPRLGPWAPAPAAPAPNQVEPVAPPKGALMMSGLTALAVVALWAALVLAPGAPLRDVEAVGPAQWTPFFRSLVSGFFLMFLLSGCVYGLLTGSIRKDADVVRLMAESIAAMAPYIVLAFVASHFIAMFNWSNLGAITAIKGADVLRQSGLPLSFILLGVTVLGAALDMFIASASAKWAALGPVLVPMLMLLGVSPEMTTAAYRMGDSSLVIASPMTPYFILILGFARRWAPGMGVGGLLSTLLPYALAFFATGLVVTGLWATFALATGPAAPFHYLIPS